MIAWLFAAGVGSAGALAAEEAADAPGEGAPTGAPREVAAAEVPATCFAGEAAVGRHVSIAVRADGTVEYDGRSFATDAGDAVRLPPLVEAFGPLAAWDLTPRLVLDADPDVGFERVRRVLQSYVEAGLTEVVFVVDPPGEAGRCALRLADNRRAGATWDPAYVLSFHLGARGVCVGREPVGGEIDGVMVFDAGGARAWDTLRAVLRDEARGSGAANTLVVLNAEDGVRAGDLLGLFAVSREAGFGGTLLAGGPPGAGEAPTAPPAPEPVATVEPAARVEVGANGDVGVSHADGRAETIPLAEVAGFEERCAGAACGLVLRTASGRGVAFGARPAGGAAILLGRPVYRYAGAPAAAQPTRTGTLTVLAPRGR